MRRSPLIATAGALVLAVSATLPAIASAAAPASAATVRPAGLGYTTTPIKHMVVIIGENHTFDNVFAAYQPPKTAHRQPAVRGDRHRQRRPRAAREEGGTAQGFRHQDVHAQPDDHGRLHHPAAAQYDLRRHGM
jgi:phospholipase C